MKNIISWTNISRRRSALKRRVIRQRVWKTLNIVVAITTLLNVSAIGSFLAPQTATAVQPPDVGNGSVWTTQVTCLTPADQDANEYANGDHVYVRGKNFAANTDYFGQISGQPGNASEDPGEFVAGFSAHTDGTGYFCADAYIVGTDDGTDDGVYTVDVWDNADHRGGSKNDNYHVNGILFGSITVSKAIDTDGDGAFEGGDTEGNTAGFRWGVDLNPTDRMFGTTLVDVTSGDYNISENSQNGYHPTGWFYTNGDGSCSNPDGTTLPASISVASNEDTAVTICNARNVYRIQVSKMVVPMEGETDWNPSGWTWSLDSESGIDGGAYRDVIGGATHTITETPNMFSAPGYTTTWQCHPYESESLLGSGEGRTFNTDQLDFGADNGDWVYCYFTNREVPTYGIHGQKFGDLNGNGLWDEGETGLNGWTIFLDTSNDGVLNGEEQSVQTKNDDGQDGWYVFHGLPAGTYRICEVQQGGWSQTYPQNDNNNCHSITVGGELIDRLPVNTCSTQETQNSILAPSCNFGNKLNPVIIQSVPSLTITKVNSVTTFANPGTTVTYTVVVKNVGNGTATNVDLTDVLPSGFTFTGGASTKTFNLGDIAPGASVTTTYVVGISASQAAGTYTNTATADGDNTSPVSATSKVEVRVPTVLGVQTNPDLSITKAVNPTDANPGDVVTYTVTIKNSGDGDAVNVVVTDELPAGFTYFDGGGTTKTWTFATLAAGSKEVIIYAVTVGEDVTAGVYLNRAFVLADGFDPIVAQAAVEVRVPQVLGLATTGVSSRDFGTFGLGIVMLALGFIGLRKLRLDPEGEPIKE